MNAHITPSLSLRSVIRAHLKIAAWHFVAALRRGLGLHCWLTRPDTRGRRHGSTATSILPERTLGSVSAFLASNFSRAHPPESPNSTRRHRIRAEGRMYVWQLRSEVGRRST